MTNPRPRAWPALPFGAAAGSLASIAAALIDPELYTDWGSLTGALVVIPVVAILAALVVTVPCSLHTRYLRDRLDPGARPRSPPSHGAGREVLSAIRQRKSANCPLRVHTDKLMLLRLAPQGAS